MPDSPGTKNIEKKIEVLIVDDHDIARAGIISTLAGESDIVVKGEATSGREALNTIASDDFDVIVLDISMNDLDGLEVLGQLAAKEISTPVLIMTQHDEEPYIVHAFKLGASGYVHKQRAVEELIVAIRTVFQGRSYLSPCLSGQVATKLNNLGKVGTQKQFSTREFQLIRLAVAGMNPTEIAEKLHLTPQAISAYRGRIKKKLGFRNFEQVIVYAVKNGLDD